MRFGILKDIKAGENRVIATPTEVAAMTAAGHSVWAQQGCGRAAGFADEAYARAGAVMKETAEEIYGGCDLVAKVKEMETSEYSLLREGQIIFCCLHPAGNPPEVEALLASKVIAITAEDSHRYGSPNCEAAGKQGALFGLESLLTINGGKGKYVGGFAGAPPVSALVLGGGTVGKGALQVLHALGADVTVMDINVGILREIKENYHGQVDTVFCSKQAIQERLPQTDLIINCVKWPKERQDFLVDKAMLSSMEPGSVLVDISNDEPGAIESSRATHHDDPRYVVNGVVHYCVSNIPGAIAHSTSVAYAGEMLPHFMNIMNLGLTEAMARDGYLRRSLTTYHGILTHEETSALQNRPWMPPERALNLENRVLDQAPPATVTRSALLME